MDTMGTEKPEFYKTGNQRTIHKTRNERTIPSLTATVGAWALRPVESGVRQRVIRPGKDVLRTPGRGVQGHLRAEGRFAPPGAEGNWGLWGRAGLGARQHWAKRASMPGLATLSVPSTRIPPQGGWATQTATGISRYTDRTSVSACFRASTTLGSNCRPAASSRISNAWKCIRPAR